MRRPLLHPGLRRAWRDQWTLQLGTGAGPGGLLTGLGPGDAGLLAALDGAHDLEGLRDVARRLGLRARRADELVEALDRLGAVHEAPPPLGRHGPRLGPDVDTWSAVGDPAAVAARAGARVDVDGAGRLGSAIAVTLAAAGVGRVRAVGACDGSPVTEADVLPAGVAAADVGSRRATAVARAVARTTGTTGAIGTTGATADDGPDLVVLVRDDALPPGDTDALLAAGVPHLAVVLGLDRVVVGPFVVPGEGPCLRCLDLHRCDRDPGWPRVAAQLAADGVGRRPRGEAASATAAAGLAALQVLARLDGRTPATLGRTLALVLPDGLVERRRWRPHDRCGCTRLPGAANGAGMHALGA